MCMRVCVYVRAFWHVSIGPWAQHKQTNDYEYGACVYLRAFRHAFIGPWTHHKQKNDYEYENVKLLK